MYGADRELREFWKMAVCATLAAGKTHGEAVRAADNVRTAFEERFPDEVYGSTEESRPAE